MYDRQIHKYCSLNGFVWKHKWMLRKKRNATESKIDSHFGVPPDFHKCFYGSVETCRIEHDFCFLWKTPQKKDRMKKLFSLSIKMKICFACAIITLALKASTSSVFLLSCRNIHVAFSMHFLTGCFLM